MAQHSMTPRQRDKSAERERQYPVDRLGPGRSGFMDRVWNMMPFGSEESFTPQIDVTETDDQVRVSAELPGMDRDDIEVSLSHNILTISGEKRQEREEEREGYTYTERSYGSFRRSVTLPSSVNTDQVQAIFEKGVLNITLPKTEEARSQKRIKVKSR